MLKDQLIKKISEELQLPEEMVDKIVMWSCKDVHDAFSLYRSVEISGFGSMEIYPRKAQKRLRYLEAIKNNVEKNPIISKQNTEMLASLEKDIEYINKKL